MKFLYSSISISSPLLKDVKKPEVLMFLGDIEMEYWHDVS